MTGRASLSSGWGGGAAASPSPAGSPYPRTWTELQLHEVNASRSLPLALDEEGMGTLYWMRTQGYVVVDGRETLVVDETGAERFRIGSVGDTVPSPDGAVIAAVGYEWVVWSVEMLDAGDGRSRVTVEVPIVAAGWWAFTWTPDGRLVVQTDADRGLAVAIAVDGTTEVVPEPACWSPRTTSSAYGAFGCQDDPRDTGG